MKGKKRRKSVREQRNKAAVDGVSGEAEILGQFKNTAAVSLSLHSSPSMIQLSGRSAGFTGPRINGSLRSWLDSRGAAGRTRPPDGASVVAALLFHRSAPASQQPFLSPKHQKLIISPPAAIGEKQNAQPD